MKTAEDLEAAPISFKVSKILSFGTLALITAIRTNSLAENLYASSTNLYTFIVYTALWFIIVYLDLGLSS